MTRISPVGLLLSAWLGASILFAAVVAPAAFAVLPSRTLAGALVGRVLPVVFVAGIVIALLGVMLDRGDVGRLLGVRRWAFGAMLVACAAAQFVVGPRIERIRREISGPIEQLPQDDARRAAFGRLHAVSVGWLGLAMLSATTVLVLTSLAPQARPASVSQPTLAPQR